MARGVAGSPTASSDAREASTQQPGHDHHPPQRAQHAPSASGDPPALLVGTRGRNTRSTHWVAAALQERKKEDRKTGTLWSRHAAQQYSRQSFGDGRSAASQAAESAVARVKKGSGWFVGRGSAMAVPDASMRPPSPPPLRRPAAQATLSLPGLITTVT